MRTDRQLHKDIVDALAFDPSVDASNIGIAVHEGVVSLTGEVPSLGDRWSAEKIVKHVAGVRALVEALKVVLPEQHQRTDTDIAQAVLAALKWDVNVPHEALQVKVEDGWVTLTGDAPWQFQRNHAESATRYITGVRGVTNLIQVKPSVSPLNVRMKIQQALARQARFDANHIQVGVEGGTVTLRGQVPTLSERESAEHAAWSAPGVSKVVNDLKVEPSLIYTYSAIDA